MLFSRKGLGMKTLLLLVTAGGHLLDKETKFEHAYRPLSIPSKSNNILAGNMTNS
jgi:hypothetical protein